MESEVTHNFRIFNPNGMEVMQLQSCLTPSMIRTMTIKIVSLLLLPGLLGGCVAGTVVSGETRLLHEPYPDVRTVPTRTEATQPRGGHSANEVQERAQDFKSLEVERANQQKRDQELRQEKVDLPQIPEVPKLDLEDDF